MSFAVWFGVCIGKSRCQASSAGWPKEENKCISVCLSVLTHALPALYRAEAGPTEVRGRVVFHHDSHCFLLEASSLR